MSAAPAPNPPPGAMSDGSEVRPARAPISARYVMASRSGIQQSRAALATARLKLRPSSDPTRTKTPAPVHPSHLGDAT